MTDPIQAAADAGLPNTGTWSAPCCTWSEMGRMYEPTSNPGGRGKRVEVLA